MAGAPIRITDLRFRWHPQHPWVLDIAALDVAAGEKLFLHGPSGSGKTTLLNLMGGVTVPHSGAVSILQTDLAALSGARRDRFRADHIGFIFQMFNLVPYLTLVENVVLPCRFSAARRERALSRATSLDEEARRLLSHMELDVVTLADRPVAELSTGQQQRVAAARSLIGGPELIIADEPTSSLDAAVRRVFLDLLFREIGKTGATLLFVSHDVSLADAFDRMVALADLNRTGGRA